MESWAWIIGSFVFGASLATIITYFWTLNRKGVAVFNQLLDARVEAAEERTRRIAEGDYMRHFTHEVQYWPKETGWGFWKATSVIVEERLLFRGLPLMAPVHSEHVLTSEIDIGQLTDVVRNLAGLVPATGVPGITKNVIKGTAQVRARK